MKGESQIDMRGLRAAQKSIEAEWPDCTVSVGLIAWAGPGEPDRRRHVDYSACVLRDTVIAYARTGEPGELLDALRADTLTHDVSCETEAPDDRA
ncbi:MAG: hypothetical protein AMXMBFR64_60840 [Myxococcales bacterium]